MMIDRCAVIAATGAAAIVPGARANAAAGAAARWPKRFLWGTATAARQIEGNTVGSGYWLLGHLPGTNFVEPSGDACDSWDRWREDLAMLRPLGVHAYRFSIEWAI